MPLYTQKCNDCGRKYDLLSLGGLTTNLDNDDNPLMLHCPDCGGESETIIGASMLKDLGGEAGVGRDFPRFDHGLGTHVRDAAHHRWLMTHTPDGTPRPVPLRPTNGDLDFETLGQEHEREAEAAEARYQEQQDEMLNGPNREAYRKLVDHLENHGTELWEREIVMPMEPTPEELAADDTARAKQDGMAAVGQTIPEADEPLKPSVINATWQLMGPALKRLTAGQFTVEPYAEVTEPQMAVPPELGTKIAAIGAMTQQTPALKEYAFDPVEMMRTNAGLTEVGSIIDSMSRDEAVLEAMQQPPPGATPDAESPAEDAGEMGEEPGEG